MENLRQYKLLITILLILVIGKGVIHYYDDIKEVFLNKYYVYATSKFDKVESNESLEKVIKKHKKVVIYFGRSTCPDCVAAIGDICKSKEAFEENGYKIFYFNTEQHLSPENKNYLKKTSEIREIPALLVIHKNFNKLFYEFSQKRIHLFLKGE